MTCLCVGSGGQEPRNDTHHLIIAIVCFFVNLKHLLITLLHTRLIEDTENFI